MELCKVSNAYVDFRIDFFDGHAKASEGSGTCVFDALCSFFTMRDRIDVSWQIFYFTVFWPCY